MTRFHYFYTNSRLMIRILTFKLNIIFDETLIKNINVNIDSQTYSYKFHYNTENLNVNKECILKCLHKLLGVE